MTTWTVRGWTSHSEGRRALTRELAGFLTIVGPTLFVVQGLTTAGLRDINAIAERAKPVLARIVSVEPVDGVKGIMVHTDVVLRFRPLSSAESCRTSLRVDDGRSSLKAGDDVLVIPRSTECDTPILPADIHSTRLSALFSVLFLICGLVATRVWLQLSEDTSRMPLDRSAGTASRY